MLYYLIKLQQPVTTHWCLWVHNCFTSMRYSGFESFSGHIPFYLLHDVRPLCPPLPSPLSDLFSLLPLIIYLINNHLVSPCTHHYIPQIRLSLHLTLQVPLRDPQLSPFTTFTFILLWPHLPHPLPPVNTGECGSGTLVTGPLQLISTILSDILVTTKF